MFNIYLSKRPLICDCNRQNNTDSGCLLVGLVTIAKVSQKSTLETGCILVQLSVLYILPLSHPTWVLFFLSIYCRQHSCWMCVDEEPRCCFGLKHEVLYVWLPTTQDCQVVFKCLWIFFERNSWSDGRIWGSALW